MRSVISICAFCLAAVGALAAQADTTQNSEPHQRAYEAPGHVPIGEPDSSTRITRTVQVSIIETENGKMLFEPDAIHIEEGSVVRFEIKNGGLLDHEFFLGSFDEIGEHKQWMHKHPNMKHENANAVFIPSGETAELVWRFSSKTNLEFVCLIPGHRDAGMWGVIMVHNHLAPKSKD